MGLRVVFIGAGNLATSVALGMHNAGFTIGQVVTRSTGSARELAARVMAKYTNSIAEIDSNADLYVIAVPDAQIEPVVNSLRPLNGLVVHTSGSTPIDVFDSNKFPNHGVLYPFQTFSKSIVVDLHNVSICIEANSPQNEEQIVSIASQLSAKVVPMKSEQRRWLHLIGVFGSNFVNLILTMAYEIATNKGIDFEIIKPLVGTTVQKAFSGNPAKMQTGPAIRNDQNTMDEHLQMLKDLNPDLQKIYNELSLEIQKIAKSNWP